MGRGRLIVLEGVDGSGTTTQAKLLVNALRDQGLPAHTTREPSDGPVGMLIRQILTRRLVVPGGGGGRPPRMETMALLFAADRVDHLESEMLPNLGDGITVVCDRYVHSSIAYQTLTASPGDEEALPWVLKINSRARKPDLVIVLDVPAELAARRRGMRGGAEEVYEDDELQKRLAAFFTQLPDRFPNDRIVVIDGSGDMGAVHERCIVETMKVLGECTR